MVQATKRGSEWRKWDLHIHTPYSIEQDYGGYTPQNWEKFITDLEALPSDIKVIGINDYIFIDGYAHVLKEKNENGRLKNIDLILPVIELRIDKFANISSADPFKRVNFHIIFSNEITPKVIQDQFLNSLFSVYKLDSDSQLSDSDWGGLITKESLISLGEKMIQTSGGQLKSNPLKIGFNSFNVPYDQLLTKLENPHLRNKFLTAIGKTEWDSLRWDGSPAEKKSIINKSKIVFSASPTVDLALKAKESLKAQNVNDNLLHCSDAHGYINDLSNTQPKELGHCFNWIKADTTFEGLKQIIYEPEQRVKIQKEEPDFKDDKLLIDEVVFISDNNKFTPIPIKFNKNLNVIIGGKSSGKSILLYNIAKTLLTDRNILKHKNPDNGRLEYKYEFDNSFNFEVTIKSGNKQSISRGDNEPSILSDIKYIPQNYLSELAERKNKKGNELNKLVRDLLLEDDIYIQKYNAFLSNVRLNDSKREDHINNFFSLKEKVATLGKVLNAKGSEEVLSSGIANNEKKVDQLKQSIGLTEAQIAEYNSYNTQLELVNLEFSKFQSDYRKIIEFNNEAKNIISQLVTKKEIFINSIEIEELKHFLADKYNPLNTLQKELSEVDSILQLDENNTFIKKSELNNLLLTLGTQKNELENHLKPLVQNNEIKRQIEIIEKSISDDKQKISEINQLKTEINTNVAALNDEKDKIFELYKENYLEYHKIIQDFHLRISSLEDDKLQINGYPKFNFLKFRLELESISDLRSLRNIESLNYIYDQNKHPLSKYDIDLIIKDLKDTFECIENNSYPLVRNISPKEASKKLLNDYFFDYWEVESDNDTLDKMSTGKASFIILKLIISLSKSKAPILIDQPEDNLDNRSISRDLVEYLKNRKLDRQIILVTHNANVVVNADAENIIVANQKGQNDNDTTSPYQFDYINGSIENTFAKIGSQTDLLKSMGIREHIADIVEGGEDAFKKREQKYGF